ncbi:MAG: response regulator [Rhodobacteraceae bacterium]|nr:response regulator [Paracoccaceae bacterium]
MKFLAVDDEPLILDVLRATLGPMENTEFHTETDPEKALTRLRDENFDCFLLDVHMPGMSGIELVAAIRETERHADTPILMITSASEREIIEEAYGMGATDYICKPIDRRDVVYRVRLVKRLLKEREQFAQEAGLAGSECINPFIRKRFFRDVGLMREFNAFENYVQTLSKKSLLSFTFLGIHVTNAGQMHSQLDVGTYEQVLEDISRSLANALADEQAVFAHAGGGNFIVALKRFANRDMEAVMKKTRNAMKAYEVLYSRDGISLPTLQAGISVTPTFFSISKQNDLIDRVLDVPKKSKLANLPPVERTAQRIAWQ